MDIACSIKRKVALSAAFFAVVLSIVAGACSTPVEIHLTPGAGGAHPSSGSDQGGGEITLDTDAGDCDPHPMCSNDLNHVVDCKGQILST